MVASSLSQVRATALLAAAALALAGCGDAPPPPAKHEAAKPKPARKRAPNAPRVEPLHCAASAPPSCRAAWGRVLYVEAVDADGDGDAHFVLASRQSVSGPGITAVDLERELRPRRLPRVGDAVAAAGPVYRGSFGQRQIEAVELRIARAPRRAP
jgi:hypothetical protein